MMIDVQKRLDAREKEGSLRSLTLSSFSTDFSSNDYLGLARLPECKQRVFEEYGRYESTLGGHGSTGSRLLSGNCLYAQALEQKIAAFHGYDAGTLFNCGYMANIGVLSTIGGADDVFLFDHDVHASMHAGLQLSPARAISFRHNCLEHLENRLQLTKHAHQRFICIESVYSTDGSISPLREIAALARKYSAYLIVDEAHATGVLGPHGKGLIAQMNVSDVVLAHIVTFGKALGAHGAIVLGSATLQKALINFASSYIYTTALPWISLAAIDVAYSLFPSMDKERAHLQKLIHTCSTELLSSSITPIQGVIIPGNLSVDRVAKICQARGYDVRALKHPTVRKGLERLRICLHSFNTQEELLSLIECIQTSLKEISCNV